ncbi:MAG TPA: serine/threonine-protein kinase [Gemmataceae bacterium]|jgi:tetratricopeptide (TPR) repeat protein|nr:serine/threonine-protein kinase [Gemmataceae bacterium]
MTPTVEAHAPKTDRDTVTVVDSLVADLVARWQAGDRPLVESLLDRRPELWDNPEVALELIAEELVLRSEFGEPTTAVELKGRFPQWAAQVEVLLDCQATLGPQLTPPRFPEPSQRLGEFHLLSQLGKGAHGRVYLAAQESLGERAVVLKLGPWAGGEHLSLARLQHTHIVPLYSAHEFPERGLRGLCLPYFGGATLADLFPEGGPGPLSGQGLLAAVREAGPATLAQPIVGGFLERATPAEIVCWVGACLADALQYAHDRGLLHLDLKPSNVLIAADGTPMLLDFHLAHPPLKSGDPPPAWAGGTVGYMAPEQAAAMKAVADGKPVSVDVDGRADVFALGVLLAELWGRLAAGKPRGSVALADVLTRCTAAEARDRYPNAALLASDLRRHLTAMPLRGVRNRSWKERWHKWRKRHPLGLPLALAAATILVVGIGLTIHGNRQSERARMSLRSGQAYVDEGRFREAIEVSRTGIALLNGVPFQGELRAQLDETRQLGERGQAAAELHLLCEQVRPLYAADALTPEQASSAAAHCRELWSKRLEIANRLANQPTAELEGRWRIDLLDLGILTAHLEAAVANDRTGHERAIAILTEAEELLGPSGVLYLERARHERALEKRELAEGCERQAERLPPRTAWEHLAFGRARLQAGNPTAAVAALDRCIELDPRSVWGNYYRGVCALRLKEPLVALAAFSACLALNPDSPWCLYNRGLAYQAAGRADRAKADVGRALAIDPNHGPARELQSRLLNK